MTRHHRHRRLNEIPLRLIKSLRGVGFKKVPQHASALTVAYESKLEILKVSRNSYHAIEQRSRIRSLKNEYEALLDLYDRVFENA